MRIVAGEWRGRRLVAPTGTKTRPTSDRVREALFSSLGSLLGSWDGIVVLDAFAGSGALGLEALSRGADRATFIERDRAALTALRRNVESLHAADRARVLEGDAFRVYARLSGTPVSLLLLDPPYRIEKSKVRGLIEQLAADGTLVEGSVIVWEHASNAPIDLPPFAESVASRVYGSTAVEIARVTGSDEEAR